MSLPPLPESFPAGYIAQTEYFYTADQLKAYGQACREAALEEAAQAALNAPIKTAMQPYREACANAIRSLK